jgi:hypothetical protein
VPRWRRRGRATPWPRQAEWRCTVEGKKGGARRRGGGITAAKGRAAGGGSTTGEPGGGDVREGAWGEREMFWGEGRLTGGAHRGKAAAVPTAARTVHVGAGGEGWAAEAGWATRGGLAGPPSRPKKERGGEAAAGPRAWLGREPGWAARLAGPQGEGEGREGKTSFSLSTLFAK